jgi:hypothetical protein
MVLLHSRTGAFTLPQKHALPVELSCIMIDATAAGLAAFNLTDALVWNALDFTKAPGLCGGGTGYWAAPPQP